LHRKCCFLERFSNTYALTNSVEGGFFLMKKPLGGKVSVYSKWRTAITVRIGISRAGGADSGDGEAKAAGSTLSSVHCGLGHNLS
jgi:hypothetical protein